MCRRIVFLDIENRQNVENFPRISKDARVLLTPMGDDEERSPVKAASDELLNSALRNFELSRGDDDSVKSNAKVIGLLDSVEALYSKKVELHKKLAAAYLSLTYAQRNEVHKTSIEDAKEEIEAGVRLKESHAGWVQMERDVEDLKSLSLLSGLPSAKLRSCQKEFHEALDMVIEVDRRTREVEAELAKK